MPLGELPQLVDGEQHLGLRRREGRHGPLRLILRVLGGNLQAKAEGRQALLRPIVEVVLEAPAFGVRRLDQPGAGGAEPFGEPLPLGDHSGQAQRRERRDGDEQLRAQHAVGDRPGRRTGPRSGRCSTR